MLDPKPPIYYFEAKFSKALTDKFVQDFLKKKGIGVPLYLKSLQDMAKLKPDNPMNTKDHERVTSLQGQFGLFLFQMEWQVLFFL